MCTGTHAHTGTGTREYTRYLQFATTFNKQGRDTEDDIKTQNMAGLIFSLLDGDGGGGAGVS